MTTRIVQRKRQGQAIVIIAGALIGLLALVALAVDGGNAFAQRRIAQNAADGATQAGITKMKAVFTQNIDATCGCVHPMTPDQSAQVLQSIKDVLIANHADANTASDTPPGTMEAWWLDPNGQRYGQAVGAFTSVEFAGGSGTGSPGAAGLWVKTTASSGTYFARIIGVNNVSSDAHAGQIMGSAGSMFNQSGTGQNGVKLWPMTINVGTLNFHGGQTSIYNFDQGTGPGNWDLIAFKGYSGGQNLVDQQVVNGFDPSTGMVIQPEVPGTRAPGADTTINTFPIGNDGNPNDGSLGFWSQPKPGNGVSSVCSTLQQAAAEHWRVGIPLNDGTNGEPGRNIRYHVVNVAIFEIQHATCPGGANSISGQFITFGVGGSSASWSWDLHRVILNGIVTTKPVQ
ncbi:MAG TPA: Tad domain-containing protein [Chloroflexia bacterium]|nr:Tad domain-containing protein [Chloroflexia bacterium]